MPHDVVDSNVEFYVFENQKTIAAGDCCRRLLPFLTPFSETEKGIALRLNTFIKCQMLQEALLHQGTLQFYSLLDPILSKKKKKLLN